MFEGDLEEGELEIGQIAGLIDRIEPVASIIENIILDFENAKKDLINLEF
jgi:enoyl-[acyl-carrier protein] reductase II